MKKYLILGLLGITGCAGSKPYSLYCMTPFGTAKIDSSDQNAKIGPYKVSFSNDEATYTLNKSLCVEVLNK